MSTRLSLTRKLAASALRGMGVSVSEFDGEYRVALQGAPEAQAYYTNDLADAIATGQAMAIARDLEASL